MNRKWPYKVSPRVDMPTEFDRWLSECRETIQAAPEVPYLDRPFLNLRRSAQDLSDWPRYEDGEVSERWVRSAESYLNTDPNDLCLRFALLFPIRDAFLCATKMVGDKATRRFSDRNRCFHQIVNTCIPEKLADRTSLQFEIHNSYLARDWDLAKRLLLRMKELELYSDAEAYAVEGHFWFLSVFGRRIETEWLTHGRVEYEFHWDFSLPLSLFSVSRESCGQLLSFAYPEPLIEGSLPHWILTAWCTNPRVPTASASHLLASELEFSKADVESAESHLGEHRDADEVRARLADQLYRNFEPLRPLSLEGDQKTRLRCARDRLLETANIAPVLAQPYEVLLARVFFNLGQYEDAASCFGRVNARHVQFREPLPDSRTEAFDWELSFFVALCQKLKGDYGQAIETLQQLHHSTNNHFGAAWWIARWQAEEGKFTEAARWLRAEIQCSYTPAESWHLAAAIAFAELLEIDLQVDAFERRLRRDNPNLHEIIFGLSWQFCPELKLLSENSRKHWLLAVNLLHAEPMFEFAKEAYYAKAVTSFAVIAENEIKVHVFDPFLEHMKDHSCPN